MTTPLDSSNMCTWNNIILNKLNEYYLLCKSKHFKHTKSAEHYKKLYTWSNIPVIILSSSTTMLASYNTQALGPNFTIAVAICSGITTVWHSLNSFLEFNTKLEKHLVTANKYINLSRMIEKEIYINYYGNMRATTIERPLLEQSQEQSLQESHESKELQEPQESEELLPPQEDLPQPPPQPIDSTGENSKYIKYLFDFIQKELSNIQDIEPLIPLHVQKQKYKNLCNDNSGIDLYDDLLF
jgi:hypothetical protein